jgi:hypothetical protein
LIKNGRSRVIVCSDSRVTGEGDAAWDDAPKLFQVGSRMLCGIVGKSGVGPADPIGEIVVRLAKNSPALGDSPLAFLEALRDELNPHFIRMFTDDPEGFVRGLAGPLLFGAFCLARSEAGNIDFFQCEIPMQEAGGKAYLGEPKITRPAPWGRGIFAYSMGQVASSESFFPLINPDDRDEVVLAAVDRTIEEFKNADAVFRHDVGGVIEVAAIDAAGFRWLRRDEAKARSTETKKPSLWRRALAAFQ